MINKELVQKAIDTIPDDMIANFYEQDGKVCSVAHLAKVADDPKNYESDRLAGTYGVSMGDLYLVKMENNFYGTSLDRKNRLEARLESWLLRE